MDKKTLLRENFKLISHSNAFFYTHNSGLLEKYILYFLLKILAKNKGHVPITITHN